MTFMRSTCSRAQPLEPRPGLAYAYGLSLRREIMSTCLPKLAGIVTVVVLFCLIAATLNIIHFRFFTVNVVLFDTLGDVLLAAIATTAIYIYALRRWVDLTPTEATLSLLVSLLIGINYAISIPTIIDRSLSIYILEKIDQRGGGIKRDAFEGVFTDEYIPEHQLVDIRLTEQLNSGTIRIENGCVKLTPRGYVVVALTRSYRTYLLPKHREIMGQLTDALTDPFRNSRTDVTYRCPS